MCLFLYAPRVSTVLPVERAGYTDTADETDLLPFFTDRFNFGENQVRESPFLSGGILNPTGTPINHSATGPLVMRGVVAFLGPHAFPARTLPDKDCIPIVSSVRP